MLLDAALIFFSQPFLDQPSHLGAFRTAAYGIDHRQLNVILGSAKTEPVRDVQFIRQRDCGELQVAHFEKPVAVENAAELG